MLDQITRKIRAYLVARSLLNAGLGIAVALGLWAMNVHFAFITAEQNGGQLFGLLSGHHGAFGRNCSAWLRR